MEHHTRHLSSFCLLHALQHTQLGNLPDLRICTEYRHIQKSTVHRTNGWFPTGVILLPDSVKTLLI